jgi:cytochrome c oxidase assembly factor CtaG
MGALLGWSIEPAVVVPVLAATTLYAVGWRTLARRMPERFSASRAIAFMAGLAIILVALCSPLDALGHHLLLAHMIQHMLLMLVAPPLLWAGAPTAPLLMGMPRSARRGAAMILAAPAVRRSLTLLTHPAVSWIAFVIAFWAWHVPALYELALSEDTWHHVEHLCFFATALLFWRPVILAWPARSPWPRWAMIPYLVLAEVQNAALAAFFTFSERVIYRGYESARPPWGLTALEDQSLAGVIMWVPGSLAFLLPLLWLVITAVLPPGQEREGIGTVGVQPALRRR